MFYFKEVDVVGHGAPMSNELKLFDVCRVDSISSKNPVLKFSSPYVRQTHE